MYGWMWRNLPGPVFVRAMICLVLFLAVAAILFQVVFPLVAPYMPFNDASVEQ